MNDRELLELAAKAAGIRGEWSERGQCIVISEAGMSWEHWRPLNDDGDALRLASHLKLCVCHTLGGVPSAHGTVMVGYSPWENTSPISTERYAGLYDRDKAVRRAIVRAAAEIERGME